MVVLEMDDRVGGSRTDDHAYRQVAEGFLAAISQGCMIALLENKFQLIDRDNSFSIQRAVWFPAVGEGRKPISKFIQQRLKIHLS